VKSIQCPETHTDTYIVSEKELIEFKNKGWIGQLITGLIGCNICEDFYELEEVKNYE
jgi:hypothetical protein|tara:strand:+ start:272 stop:442 length:171 start_codon:yes stop_codon:yes gene_type:complete